jgi:hypothetical protein
VEVGDNFLNYWLKLWYRRHTLVNNTYFKKVTLLPVLIWVCPPFSTLLHHSLGKPLSLSPSLLPCRMELRAGPVRSKWDIAHAPSRACLRRHSTTSAVAVIGGESKLSKRAQPFQLPNAASQPVKGMGVCVPIKLYSLQQLTGHTWLWAAICHLYSNLSWACVSSLLACRGIGGSLPVRSKAKAWPEDGAESMSFAQTLPGTHVHHSDPEAHMVLTTKGALLLNKM